MFKLLYAINTGVLGLYQRSDTDLYGDVLTMMVCLSATDIVEVPVNRRGRLAKGKT